MGANQSYEGDFADVTGSAGATTIGGAAAKKGRHDGEGGHHHYKRKKAKPAAPHRPNVTAVTHNAVSLTWLPPRHALHAIIAYTVEVCRPRHSTRHWATLTKNCQGMRFEARGLESDTEYVFRVRAENIFGTGKPSAPSEIVTTKIFEMSSDLSCYITPSSPTPTSFSGASPSPNDRGFPKSFSYEGGLLLDAPDSGCFNDNGGGVGGMIKSPSLPADNYNSSLSFGCNASHNSSNLSLNQNQFGSVRRRHSFNVRLEGRVSNMLSHSDRFVSSSSINSSTSTIVTSNSSESCSNININNNEIIGKSRTGSILRNNTHRSSLQASSRKSTIPILLPGTGSSSLNRLRESRSSLKSNSMGSTDALGNPIHPPASSRHNTLTMINRNRRNRESRTSFGSTASDSNTYSSSSTSSTSREESNGKAIQGSRLSLQSVLSDVTMSNHSQSSDDQSSRPVSFSDNGESLDLGIVVNGSHNDSLTTSCESNREHFDNDSGVVNVIEKDDEICHNSNTGDEDDDISKLKRDLKNLEFTEEKLKFHDLKERLKVLSEDSNVCNNNNNNNNINNHISQKEYYQSLDNPWEKGTNSVNSVSENIMAAPFTDDIKLALNARNGNSDDVYRLSNSDWRMMGCDVMVGQGQEKDDFRTLRSVLQSNHVIVKQSRSMPEVVGVVLGEGGETTTLTRGKLTTIADEDEEEEAVRVTTL